MTETTALLETRAESYRDQLNSYAELAQVGMALGIVQHEFSATVKAINDGISRLQPWSRANPSLARLVREVRSGFDHLESYLRLFTPMSRRLHRDTIDMTGEQICLYLDEVFGDRVARHGVKLRHTRRFDEARIRERWIELDTKDGAFLVTNGGPGIEHRDAERIFEFGQTNKPAGRGMGLYISRQALNREGWDLTLETIGRDTHPTFRIGSKPAEDGEKDDEMYDRS